MAVKHHRALGSSLDALVRSARSGSPTTRQIAERTLAVWRDKPLSRLELQHDRLLVDGKVGIETGPEEGRWLLAPYLSGLRSIRLREDAGVWDILRFAQEIAHLDSRIESLDLFRDWLWSDGAEGFEVEIQTSFVEVVETLDTTLDWMEWAAAAVRSISGLLMGGETQRVASTDLDAASLREQFQARIDMYGREEGDPARRITRDKQDRLREVAEDDVVWAEVEVDTILSHPELRNTIPPDRLARRLVGMVERNCDHRICRFLSLMGTWRDDYSRIVLATLVKADMGARIATNIVFDDDTDAALTDSLNRAPEDACRGLLNGLLDRAVTDPQVFVVLISIGKDIDTSRLNDLVKAGELNADRGRVLAKIIAEGDGRSEWLRSVIRECAPDVRVAILATLSPKHRTRFSNEIIDLFHKSRQEDVLPLARVLHEGNDTASLRLFTDVILATKGRFCRTMDLREPLGRLASSGSDADCLVNLAQSREISVSLRLQALRALRVDPDGLAKASGKRFTDLTEPKEIREALREARTYLKRRGP